MPLMFIDVTVLAVLNKNEFMQQQMFLCSGTWEHEVSKLGSFFFNKAVSSIVSITMYSPSNRVGVNAEMTAGAEHLDRNSRRFL